MLSRKRMRFAVRNGTVRALCIREGENFTPPAQPPGQIYGLIIEGAVYFCLTDKMTPVPEMYLTDDILGQITNVYYQNFTVKPEFYNGIRELRVNDCPVHYQVFNY